MVYPKNVDAELIHTPTNWDCNSICVCCLLLLAVQDMLFRFSSSFKAYVYICNYCYCFVAAQHMLSSACNLMRIDSTILDGFDFLGPEINNIRRFRLLLLTFIQYFFVIWCVLNCWQFSSTDLNRILLWNPNSKI